MLTSASHPVTQTIKRLVLKGLGLTKLIIMLRHQGCSSVNRFYSFILYEEHGDQLNWYHCLDSAEAPAVLPSAAFPPSV